MFAAIEYYTKLFITAWYCNYRRFIFFFVRILQQCIFDEHLQYTLSQTGIVMTSKKILLLNWLLQIILCETIFITQTVFVTHELLSSTNLNVNDLPKELMVAKTTNTAFSSNSFPHLTTTANSLPTSFVSTEAISSTALSHTGNAKINLTSRSQTLNVTTLPVATPTPTKQKRPSRIFPIEDGQLILGNPYHDDDSGSFCDDESDEEFEYDSDNEPDLIEDRIVDDKRFNNTFNNSDSKGLHNKSDGLYNLSSPSYSSAYMSYPQVTPSYLTSIPAYTPNNTFNLPIKTGTNKYDIISKSYDILSSNIGLPTNSLSLPPPALSASLVAGPESRTSQMAATTDLSTSEGGSLGIQIGTATAVLSTPFVSDTDRLGGVDTRALTHFGPVDITGSAIASTTTATTAKISSVSTTRAIAGTIASTTSAGTSTNNVIITRSPIIDGIGESTSIPTSSTFLLPIHYEKGQDNYSVTTTGDNYSVTTTRDSTNGPTISFSGSSDSSTSDSATSDFSTSDSSTSYSSNSYSSISDYSNSDFTTTHSAFSDSTFSGSSISTALRAQPSTIQTVSSPTSTEAEIAGGSSTITKSVPPKETQKSNSPKKTKRTSQLELEPSQTTSSTESETISERSFKSFELSRSFTLLKHNHTLLNDQGSIGMINLSSIMIILFLMLL